MIGRVTDRLLKKQQQTRSKKACERKPTRRWKVSRSRNAPWSKRAAVQRRVRKGHGLQQQWKQHKRVLQHDKRKTQGCSGQRVRCTNDTSHEERTILAAAASNVATPTNDYDRGKRGPIHEWHVSGPSKGHCDALNERKGKPMHGQR